MLVFCESKIFLGETCRRICRDGDTGFQIWVASPSKAWFGLFQIKGWQWNEWEAQQEDQWWQEDSYYPI